MSTPFDDEQRVDAVNDLDEQLRLFNEPLEGGETRPGVGWSIERVTSAANTICDSDFGAYYVMP